MHADSLIGALASQQHGVVSYAQLSAAGVTRRAVNRRVQSGHLLRLHRGVYAVGHVALPPLARLAAALLALGPHAVLSHLSAAAVWGLLPLDDRAPVDVAVMRGQPRPRPGIRVHRPTRLTRREARIRSGLRLTSPERTLCDLASVLSSAALERAAAEALARRLVADLPAGLADDPRRTRSEAERRFLQLVRAAGLPDPETNVRVAGFEVDALWREQRLAVEIDGWRFHGHRIAFERDRERDQVLQAAGTRLFRVTWRQLDRPHRLVARLAAALAR